QHLPLGNILLVETQELGDSPSETFEAQPHEPQTFRPGLDADGVSRADQITGNVHPPPVDADVPMTDELPRLTPRPCESHAVHDVVKPPFQKAHQRAACITLRSARNVDVPPELPLEHAVISLHLLLFAEP